MHASATKGRVMERVQLHYQETVVDRQRVHPRTRVERLADRLADLRRRLLRAGRHSARKAARAMIRIYQG